MMIAVGPQQDSHHLLFRSFSDRELLNEAGEIPRSRISLSTDGSEEGIPSVGAVVDLGLSRGPALPAGLGYRSSVV